MTEYLWLVPLATAAAFFAVLALLDLRREHRRQRAWNGEVDREVLEAALRRQEARPWP